MTTQAPSPHAAETHIHDHYIDWSPAPYPCRVLTPAASTSCEPLLVLGGGLQNRHSWARLERRLCPDHQLLIPDLPPARSPGQTRTSLTWDDLTQAALAAADQLRTTRFAVLAVSSGYPVGYRLAQQHPTRITRLMLFGAAPHPTPRLAALIKEGLDREAAAPQTATTDSRRSTAARLVDVLTNPQAAQQHLLMKVAAHVMLEQLTASPHDPLTRYVFDRGALLLKEPLPPGGLTGIPALVGVGEYDTATTVEDNRAVAQTIAGSTFLVMQRADHLLHLERDADFATAVSLFLHDQSLRTLSHSVIEQMP
ncbi:alpha/beta fold hydrolase [Streptomyces sp. NPDC059999]|uniref:alpha/beta fold hydrolase n=1 Tax=Streptomyces sp. NPDC059999 TaxID=3347030 RepID=UPI003693B9C9